jgi:probable selenium-dependent hydroxylase accessory protein YqeC
MNTLIDTLQLKQQGIVSIIGGGGKTSLMFRLAKELADSGKNVLTTTTTKIFMPTPDQSPFTIIEGSIDELVKKSRTRLKHYPHFSAGRNYDLTKGKLDGFTPDSINELWQARLFDWIIVEADGARQKPLKATASHEPQVPEATTHLVLVTGLDAIGTPLDETHVHRAGLFSNNTGLPMGATVDESSIAASIAVEIKKAALFSHDALNFVFLNKADRPDLISAGEKIAGHLQTDPMIHKIITASIVDDVPVKNYFILKK